MDDSRITIFSENPEEDLWKKLLQYTYKSQIIKYFQTNRIVVDPSQLDIICDTISNSLLQAYEYKAIIDSRILQGLSYIKEDVARNLFLALDRDILRAPMDNVSDEILALKMRETGFKRNTTINPVDGLTLISFKLLALREMLANALRLIYNAMLGIDLTVIDKNSLVNIEKNSSNVMYKHKTILVQGTLIHPFEDIIKSIILLTIEHSDVRIHEFGSIRSATMNYTCTEGETTKLSYCVLDDELNPIFGLTNAR